jgi:hypothetical protein
MSATGTGSDNFEDLVAVDGSMNATDHATSIYKGSNAELYALHVIHNDVETSELRNEGEEYLNNVKAKTNEKNIQVKTETKDISQCMYFKR